MHFRYAVPAAAAAFLVAADCLPVQAQSLDAKPVLELADANGAYVETLIPKTLSGGNSKHLARPVPRGIVGLQLGSGTGPFRLSDLRVRLPPNRAGKTYCVRILSYDGRYWSLNPYRRSSESSAGSGIQTNSKMADRLASQYTADDMLVRLVASETCSEDASGALLPVLKSETVTAESTGKQDLIVYVNAPGEQAEVWIEDAGKQKLGSVANCSDDEDGALAFTERCTVHLEAEERKRSAKLVLKRTGSGDQAQRFDLQLPD